MPERVSPCLATYRSIECEHAAEHERHYRQQRTPEAILEELYARALSRRPTEEEMSGMMSLVGKDAKNRRAYEDILWSLLNSTEFMFNH